MKNSKTYDFFALKPPREAFLMKFSSKFLMKFPIFLCFLADDIKQETDNGNIRQIFCNLDYDPQEKKGINEIKSLLMEDNANDDLELVLKQLIYLWCHCLKKVLKMISF